MEKYMGYRIPESNERPQRELPVMIIEGTPFFIDVKKHEFREVANKHNRMTMGNVKEEFGFSHFLYDSSTKNIYLGSINQNAVLPDHVAIIIVPPLKEIDPVGLARRHGFPDDYYHPKEMDRRPKEVIIISRKNDKPFNRSKKLGF